MATRFGVVWGWSGVVVGESSTYSNGVAPSESKSKMIEGATPPAKARLRARSTRLYL